MAEIGANTPELTVTELSGALKRSIEDRFGYVRVRGEITGYRGPHSSGHVYFGLKDQGAKIDAVIWKGVFGKLRVKPQDGLEVIATGKITTFPGKSSYQIVIEAIEPAGAGALMALLEERRRKLAHEGLFDAARKQLLPFLPRIIGVVTSPTGAVIRDIIHRLDERFPSHVLVWPVRVQGETSAAEVAAAIHGFNGFEENGRIPRPDIIIVARGGGSLEDLWSFNEEIVVRAAAESMIPLIAAIGHETDWTLIDHAADLRAPTPTAAAEKAVPVRLELLASLAELARRQAGAVARASERRRAELRGLVRALPGGQDVLAAPRQQLDRASERLQGALANGGNRQRFALAKLAQRLAAQSPQARMARAGQRLESAALRLRRALAVAGTARTQRLATAQLRLGAALLARARLASQRAEAARARLDGLRQRLLRAAAASVESRRNRLAALEKLRATLGYRNVLKRGFALVRDAAGHPLRSVTGALRGALVEIEFADGRIGASVTAGKAPKPASKPKGQGTLL